MEQKAIEILTRNRIKVYPQDKIIYVNSESIGIKLWGVIDYLIHYCKYKKVKEK